MASININNLKRIKECYWEVLANYRSDMHVPARFYADDTLLQSLMEDAALEQLVNVACLPGIQEVALGMPDMHQGYGFPIGGVAALDKKEGIISPGGIGYDINCGVRLLVSGLNYKEVEPYLSPLLEELDQNVPSGLGRGGNLKLSAGDVGNVLEQGVEWIIKRGYGESKDMERIESGGCLDAAESDVVSKEAKRRGKDQLGTLGSGNHFLEVDYIDKVLDKEKADSFGLTEGQVVLLMHSGSRGLGHQVAGEYIELMEKAMSRYNVSVPDKQLAGVPLSSPEGERYFRAMSAAANFAWANRQSLTHGARKGWKKIFGSDSSLSVLYDVVHNIAKMETHSIAGEKKQVLMERKGATRAFGPGNQEVPSDFRKAGQPVIIPGSMGTNSYVMAGTSKGEEETFGSVCHGAGRAMSRKQAARSTNVQKAEQQLQAQGVQVRSSSKKGLLEEIPAAYKDIHNVVDIIHKAGLAHKVARLRPIAVIKG